MCCPVMGTLTVEVVVMFRIMLALLPIMAAVSDRGGKYGYVVKSRQDVYRKLKKKYGKKRSAMIANGGRTKAGRKAMARKAARTRARRRR